MRVEQRDQARVLGSQCSQLIGLGMALEALKDVRTKPKATADDLWRYAKICRVANVMRPYLEAIE